MSWCSARVGHLISDSYMDANDQYAVRFDSPVGTGATLILQFGYKLIHKDTGFHLTPYTATDGSQILLGATHMQVPVLKASYSIMYCKALTLIGLMLSVPSHSY